MQPRKLFAVAAGLALLSGLSYGERANAQNDAPFTIRFPPDGSTVREKVTVKVPLASIPEGGYVAYSIDGEFRVALSPTQEQRDKARPNQNFEFVWDTKAPFKGKGMTKAVAPADGEHTITARLFTASTEAGGILKETSSVKINVENKFANPPSSVKLRYKYIDGSQSTYNRTGTTAIVAGLTQGSQATEDQELIAQNSEVLVAVEDKYPTGNAIVRNLLKKLSVRQGGTETTYPTDTLPKALYQELDPYGKVQYQNHSVSFDEFAQLGIPVTATLELPILPSRPVAPGDSWKTENVSLDLPGTAPDKQPHVDVESTFESVEWQGGYPTAKIHQKFSGTGARKLKTITVGNIEVMNPQITFEQDIYVAYNSGTLVKVVRTLDITGKTMQGVSPTMGGSGMAPGGMTGSSMGMMGGSRGAAGGMSGMTLSGGANMGAMMGSMQRGRGAMGGGTLSGGGNAGAMMGSMQRGRGGRSGPGGGSSMGPGMPGMPGGAGLPAMPGGGGTMGGSTMGGSMMGGGTPTAQPTQITLKSTTTTELKPKDATKTAGK